MKISRLVTSALALILAAVATAQDATAQGATAQGAAVARKEDKTPDQQLQIMGQATVIGQHLFPFRSPYSGPNSLISKSETEISHTYTLYVGKRLTPRWEAYVDAEMARGAGVSNALGLAGYTNGDVIRNPTLSQDPYLARAMLRYTIPIGNATETVEEAENQLAGHRPSERVVLTGGKLGTNDIFDTNAYANSTRTQFMNWDLLNNAAYDYAADTRGYTYGIAVEWIRPDGALRVGSFQMPTVANGIQLDADLRSARGDQVELEMHPRVLEKLESSKLRLLAYRNMGQMGNYQAALAQSSRTGMPPNIVSTRQIGAVKYGFGASFEQPLADGGDTGLFARAGWSDGATESFAYTEADRSLSLGLQVSGARWHAKSDLWAVALAEDFLSASHAAYLAAGGDGFLLGDGKLSYGPEQLCETYYTHRFTKQIAGSLDMQLVQNPGYNRDRGPVAVVSARMHFEF